MSAGAKAGVGRYGAWIRATDTTPRFAQAIEALGYTALWIGGSPAGDLSIIEEALDATERLLVITGVVNLWATDPGTLSASFHRVDRRHPGRFILGLGVGHRERDGDPAIAPLRAANEFLDGLDENQVGSTQRVLAALGPKMHHLAAERTLGSHPYMTTPSHTAAVRSLMGGTPLLAPEQRVVITPSHSEGLDIARDNITRFLSIVNYRNNLLRMGYTPDDLDGGGSDRIIADLAAVGDARTAASRIGAHLDAGADHVAIQVYARSETARLDGFDQLIQALPTP